jgi:large subunit ribosomal protein L14|uniref:Ribosomal protein L14 n=1 Tax=Entomoneis sp. TaxID=186043 RepID=A0A3G1PWB1_9STRA|nr:ribosomal protein L14 [Entomoneis sp.]
MIQQETLLKVADNSGAKTVKCIKVLGGYKKKNAKIGDIIVVSVKTTQNNSKKALKLRKKEVLKALVIRTKSIFKKNNGFYIKFDNNSVALLDKQKNPLGTRVIGFVPKKLKKKFNKFVSISRYLI